MIKNDMPTDGLVKQGTPRACFVCRKNLETVHIGDTNTDMPSGGTTWHTTGNYGSAVYDPMPGFGARPRALDILICDRCLEERKDLVLERTTRTKTVHSYKTWDPKTSD